jgi:hypothetical protein
VWLIGAAPTIGREDRRPLHVAGDERVRESSNATEEGVPVTDVQDISMYIRKQKEMAEQMPDIQRVGRRADLFLWYRRVNSVREESV